MAELLHIDSSGADVYGAVYTGQSITPDSDWLVDSIWVSDMRVLAGTETCVCQIWSSSGGLPDTLLGTSGGEIITTVLTPLTFTFASPVQLLEATLYWVIFYSVDSTSTWFQRTTSSAYPDGTVGFGDATGPDNNWTPDATYDSRQFKVNGSLWTTTTTTSTTTTTTTTAPFEAWDDIYYYRFTQAIANRMPDWTRAQADKYSVMQQFLNVAGKELEDMVESMRRATNSMFLRTIDMRAIDMTYQVELPYSFEFEFDFTDPTNPRPKPPDVWGIIDGNIYEISAVVDNDITSFWYEPIGDRISMGPDEETHEAGDIAKLATGDVLPATAISIGKLVAIYDDPLVPGQLYVTIAGLEKFGYKDDRIDVPGYIELKGTTVKDSDETERLPFSFDATLLTRKFWKEITEVNIYNIEPVDATITISSVAGTMQQIPDQGYVDYDTIGGRSSFWELEENNLQTVLQQLLPVSKVVETEPTMGFQLDVFREWILADATGFAIDYADVVDYAIERYRPYIYVLTSDSMLNIYNKLPEYPDLASMRLLKNRTAGPKTVVYASYEEGILGDQIRLSAKVLTKSKPVTSYYIQGARPRDNGELQYISTTGVWGSTIREARVSMVAPTVNPPYKPYLIDLDEGGCYTFVLTTRYTDGTQDKDVKIIWSRYKMPIASFDLTAVDATLTIPHALCFDYNHRLWLGGSFGADFKFKVLNLHADLMLIDYDKKLLYLREEYGRVWVGSNDPTTTTTTTTT